MERLRVRDGGDGQEADPFRRRGDPGRQQDGVEPAADQVGVVVDLPAAARLEAELVVERDEVEQTLLGAADLVHPVAGGEQLGRS